MTPDEIIRMARESGCIKPSHPMLQWSFDDSQLERFAALVAAAERKCVVDELTIAYMDGHAKGTAAERNKLATWMMEKGYATGHGDTIEDMLKELDWQIRESERKTCATDAEWCVQNHLEHLIPERIRARGESK